MKSSIKNHLITILILSLVGGFIWALTIFIIVKVITFITLFGCAAIALYYFVYEGIKNR